MKKSIKFLFAALCLLGFAACADVPEIPYPLPDPNGGGNETTGGLPFVSASLNDFKVQTIEGVDWSLGSSYAKASGYDNGSSSTTATKTWLVSPAINTTVTGDEGVSINFDNVLRYVKPSTDLKGWHKVLVSKDYDGDVTTATWTDLNFQPVESTTQTWDFYTAKPVSLPAEFIGQEKVYVAFYFQCDGVNSTTWELKNFNMQQGDVDTPTPVPVDATPVSIADFNAAPVSTSVWYELTGVASGITSSDQYGNFDLEDETGKVYVYGLLAEKGGASKAFQDLVAKTGLANGDKIKIVGQRGDYKGKIEVLNAFLVEILEKGGDTPGPGPGGEGDGSQSSPYNVAYVLSANNPGTTAWVKGYIVGTVTDKSYSDAAFGTENASNTNILLADDADCKDATKCIPVQLPQGAVRDAISLQQHPENLGKLVYLKGSLEKYFSQPGLKSVSEFTFDGDPGDNPGGNTGEEGSYPYSADFTKGENGFVTKDITLSSLSYVWQQSSSYGWKASAYKMGNQAAESWLISPTIDLSSATSPILSFLHTGNYFDGVAFTDYVSVYVLVNYSGDVTTAERTQLSIPNLPSGGVDSDNKRIWDWVESGNIDLSSFAGKKINVAFHYTSTTDVAPTWEIKTMSIE